jgi:hypothetical protein
LKAVRDHFDNSIQVLPHVVIGKTKDAAAEGFEKFLADRVFFGRVFVNRAIDLDDKLRVGAIKIRDKAVDAVLATELVSGDLPVAKMLPEAFLGRCWFVTFLAGEGFESGPEGRRCEVGMVFVVGIVGHGFTSPPGPLSTRGEGEKRQESALLNSMIIW